jgi:hypothetical protein
MIYGKMWLDFTQTPAIGRGYFTSQEDDPRLLQFRFPDPKVSDEQHPTPVAGCRYSEPESVIQSSGMTPRSLP